MQFTIKAESPDKLSADVFVLGVFTNTGAKQPAATRDFDLRLNGRISTLLKTGALQSSAGSLLELHEIDGDHKYTRIVLISLGDEKKCDQRALYKALAACGQNLANGIGQRAVVALTALKLDTIITLQHGDSWLIREAARYCVDATYRHQAKKKKAEKKPVKGARSLVFLVNRNHNALSQALVEGQASAEGMALARELGDLPGNVCTPAYLAQRARKLAKDYQLDVEILERKEMEKLGMGALLAVARGSQQTPRLIVLRYQGAAQDKKPVVLVGKGITFDSGGISLKPGAGMDEMKYDMCGAASVFGVLRAVAQMALKINLVGIVAAAENMPSGNATKPGDVVTSLSGKSIEILNTDAEGRLVLCDALSYAERFKPACVIDIATLTGAVIIALGKIPSGLMANDDDLARELIECGQDCNDRLWQLPLWPEYREGLESNFADLANIADGRSGGTITAASFLSHFTEKYRWAHLDIAGTAWNSGHKKGATGRPVPLLTRFLAKRAEDTAQNILIQKSTTANKKQKA